MIRETIAEFEDWSKEMIVSPTIQKPEEYASSLSGCVKDPPGRTGSLHEKCEAGRSRKLEEMSRSLMLKILKYPVLQLKAACKRGDAESLTEMLGNELFNLERVTDKEITLDAVATELLQLVHALRGRLRIPEQDFTHKTRPDEVE